MAQNLTTYSTKSKLRVIKAPKHSADTYGQYNYFSKLGEKGSFGSRSKTIVGNSWSTILYLEGIFKISLEMGEKCTYSNFLLKKMTFLEVFPFFNENRNIPSDK